MANITIFKRNLLNQAGIVLKNGTGGGAPALDEHADWPTSNLLSQDRYTYWRTGGNSAATLDIDFDLGSSQTLIYALLTNFRWYGADPSLTLDFSPYVLYDNGSTYPPAAWTDDFLLLPGSENDNYLSLAPSITARFVRFEFSPLGAPYAYSCKLWLCRSSDTIILSHDWSLATTFSNRRLREQLRSPAGLLFEFEPTLSIAADIPGADLILSAATLAEWEALRDGLSDVESRFVVLDIASQRAYETALPRGEIVARRRQNGLYEIRLPLEAHA